MESNFKELESNFKEQKSNFRDLYKNENDSIKPDYAFVENMISDLRSVQQRRNGIRRQRLTFMAAAGICLAVIGAVVISNLYGGGSRIKTLSSPDVANDEEIAFFNNMDEAEDGLYDAPGNAGIYEEAVEYDDAADGDVNEEEVDEEAYRDDIINYDYGLAGGEENDRENVAPNGVEVERNAEVQDDVQNEIQQETARKSNSNYPVITEAEKNSALQDTETTSRSVNHPWKGHTIAEAMYELIKEIFRTVLVEDNTDSTDGINNE